MMPSSRLVEGDDQSYRIVGDPTEGSLLIAAAKADATTWNCIRRTPAKTRCRLTRNASAWSPSMISGEPNSDDVSPFTDKKLQGWDVIAVKGAPDLILDLCTSLPDCR